MPERESPERIYRCPTCDYPLVPVWTLPKDKIKNLQDVEIREQLYCQPCDRRYAIEELLVAETAKPLDYSDQIALELPMEDRRTIRTV